MDTLRLSLLGGFDARASEGTIDVRSSKSKALLAILALSRDRAVPRAELMASLWSDRGEEQARHSLRQELNQLRQALGPAAGVLEVERDCVGLHPERTEVDAVRFEEGLASGTTEALEGTLDLYRGELLAGLQVRDRVFEEWLRLERERLRALAVGGWSRLLAVQLTDGDFARAAESARVLVELDPLNEVAHRGLMRAYAMQGERSLALDHYARFVRQLADEVGAQPEPETRRLHAAICDAEVAGPPPETGAAADPELHMVPDAAAHVALPPRSRSRSSRMGLAAATLGAVALVLGVVGVLVWTAWADRERDHARRTAELETKLEEAELEKVEIAEEAELVAVKLATEAETRRLETAAVRSELERELLALEQKLAAQEARLARLKVEQREAAAARRVELERLRARDAARDSELRQQLAGVEQERLKLERARLALEQARAQAEAARQEEIARLQARSAARAAALERDRQQLEEERERLARAQAESEAERLAALERIRAEEREKREALEAMVARLRAQRDALRARLQALERAGASAPIPLAREAAGEVDSSIEPSQVTGAEGLKPDEQIAAPETVLRSDGSDIQAAGPSRPGDEDSAASARTTAGMPDGTISAAITEPPGLGAGRPESEKFQATAVGASAPDAPTQASPPTRLALFPFPLGRDKPVIEAFRERLRRSIDASSDRFELSYDFEWPAHAEAMNALGIRPEGVWDEQMREPAAAEVYRLGEMLGVDGVVMISFRGNVDTGSAYEQLFTSRAFLLDVALGRAYTGTEPQMEFESLMLRLLTEFAQGRGGARSESGPETDATAEGPRPIAAHADKQQDNRPEPPRRLKLALFPFPPGRDQPIVEGFIKLVRRSIAESGNRFELSHSYYESELAGQMQALGISPESVWTSSTSRPRDERIYEYGERLGTDGILLVRFDAGISAGYAYAQRLHSRTHIFDVQRRERYDGTAPYAQFSSLMSGLLARFSGGRREAGHTSSARAAPALEAAVPSPRPPQTPATDAALY